MIATFGRERRGGKKCLQVDVARRFQLASVSFYAGVGIAQQQILLILG